MRHIALAVLCCASLAACNFPYRIDVQQGNYVTEDLVAKLKPGMTRAEVKLLLGTPLLTDVFHASRWDYYFSSVKGGRAQDRKRLSIFFKDDKVESFQGNAQPPGPPPVGPPVAAPTAPK